MTKIDILFLTKIFLRKAPYPLTVVADGNLPVNKSDVAEGSACDAGYLRLNIPILAEIR